MPAHINSIAAANKVLAELRNGKKVGTARLVAAVLALGAAYGTMRTKCKFLQQANDSMTVALSSFR